MKFLVNKKKRVIQTLFLFVIFLTVSCNRSNMSSSDSDYMTLDEIQYVNEFPQTFQVDNAIEVEINIIGIQDFYIYDSLLILSTSDGEGLWSFVSLPNYHFLGKFLSRGNGPYEFIQSLFFGGDIRFIKEKETLFAIIYDFQKGKLYKMNIDESIKTNRLNINILNQSLPPFLFNFIMIDSLTFFCKNINNTQTQQIRYIQNNDQKETPPHLEQLNKAAIRDGEDFNILSTSTKYNYESNLIIELPIRLNYINMYSLDGAFGKTICMGNKLDNISKILEEKEEERMYTFAKLRVFSKFWGVVYVNDRLKAYFTEKIKHSSILLFDWKGEPIAELKLNKLITSFDIDFQNGYLYTINHQTDEFYKYEISDILEKLYQVL